MEKIKLAVFHYHFLPGGITTVIKLSLISLLKNSSYIEKIALISGRNDNAENLKSAIESSVPRSNAEITVEIIPELDYLSEEAEEAGDISQNIEKTLLKYKGFIYWIHNYHVGKNPVFTKNVTDFAVNEKDEKFFFHIHDFPECSRYSNLKFLKKYVLNPYPIGNNIKYAVLNSRDYNFLKNAGMHANSLFLLPNPVLSNNSAFKKITDQDKRKIKEKFYIKTKGIYDFDPEKPVFLYPVRAIRRKNIFEAALIAMISGDGGNLIQTLPGNSDQEVNYSNLISSFYSEKYIKGLWGTGVSGSAADFDFISIIEATDAVISSSVMEGFGYIFTDTLTWGKPIISRYLETSKDFMPMFSTESSYFYNTFRIPLTPELKENLIKQIKEYFSAINNEIKAVINQDSYINYAAGSQTVDFSYLSSSLQADFLLKINKSSILKSEIKEINSALFKKTEELITSEAVLKSRDISSFYGPEIFAENFNKILKSYENITEKKAKKDNISEKLFSFFTDEKSLRLLNGIQ